MSPRPDAKRRCSWPGNPLAIAYHDREWGVPVRNDRKLFEFLILEGAQAGLSWDTILAKRENYRRALDGFDFEKIARYDAKKKKALLADAGIVRNRAKIDATIVNARAFIALRKEFGSFSRYLWAFVDGRPLQGRRRGRGDVPARTEVSDALSKDLKKRGFKFVGTTIMYAFMQAVGMVNDHQMDCFCWRKLNAKN
jgi:DNA-3-methyladenine glycosylase I